MWVFFNPYLNQCWKQDFLGITSTGVVLSPVQVFLTSSLARVYDEQVFLDDFSLTGFICLCVRTIKN